MARAGYLAAVVAMVAWVMAAAGADGAGENWPQFRGPTGMGITAEKKLPVEWGGEKDGGGKNVVWKSPVKWQGNASPIVWGEKVFVLGVAWPLKGKDVPEHHVSCYSTKDGAVLWDTAVEPGPWALTDHRAGAGGGYASVTPATDGKRVYCVFGSAVIAALDMEGKQVWRHEIAPRSFDVAMGTSPIVYGDTVVLANLMNKDSKLVAYEGATGEVKWQKPLTSGFGHSTPAVIEVAGKPQMLLAAGGALQSFDPASGEKLWWCKGSTDTASPVFADGLAYFDNGRGGAGTVVEATGAGDVTKTNKKCDIAVGGEGLGSPVISGKLLYRLVGSTLKCWEPDTGKPVFEQKLDKLSGTWASPIVDGEGRIFYATAGKSYVIQGGREFKVLGVNDLGDGNQASPAVAGGRMYLLGTKRIYCIGG